MAVNEVLRALGSWEIKLASSIPRETLDALTYFGHVAIVPGRKIPVAQHGDNLLTVARYVGVLRTRTWGDDGRTNAPLDDISIGGPGVAMWLGDEDDKGDVYENAVTPASATFATTINALLPASGAVTAGTIYSVAGTYTGRHIYETPRTSISYVCETMSTTSVPVSWRVNGDGTLDAGPESDLYVTDPRCVIVTRGAGEDMTLRALQGSMGITRDTEDYTTRVVLLAEGEGDAIATGAADISPGLNPYKDLHGNTMRMTRLVSESDTSTANATVRAQLQLNRFTSTRSELQLSTADYDIHGTFAVGDRVWVYDPDAGLVDTANEVAFRGQRLNPLKLQVTEVSWSVTADYTVAYRAADGTWTDLSDHIAWETDSTGTVTVGDFSRQLAGAGTEPVGSRPNADTSVPGVPTLVVPFVGAAYLDARGFTRARVIVSWNAPLNVDGSTVLDGDHYEIRYAVDTDMIYPATWSQLSAVRWVDLQTWAQPFAAPDGNWQVMYVAWGESTAQLQDLSPGVGYDVQIRAVDSSGNAGAWSGTTTFVASSDNLPPSTPAAPTVAASRIAVQVTHQLGKASGGTFNLESDLHHLEIHVDYEPYFTPSASTLKVKVSATAGMIQAQIPVVATVQVEEVSARYVRVVAVDQTGNTSGPSDAASSTALLIDDAHISDLTVTKVTAGTISADWIVGARIKTADTGARAEMSALGFAAYNAAGTQTFLADAATGDVSIVGRLRSGTTGQRIDMNPAGAPTIRFYPNSGSDYGFINAVSSGTDVNLGMNSSPYNSGGTDLTTRAYLTTTGGSLEVVNAATQARHGGYVNASPSGSRTAYAQSGTDTGGVLQVESGAVRALYESGGTAGGSYYADANQALIRHDPTGASASSLFVGSGSALIEHASGASTETRITLGGGYFGFEGKWPDYIAAASTQAIFTGHVATNAGTGVVIGYGATMSSTMRVIATVFDNIQHTAIITASSTTSFTMDIDPAGSGFWDTNFWCFRV
jgi:hypothetical protein